MSSPARDISQRSFRIAGGAVLLLALALRVLGARGDLAQDEITSLDIAAHVGRFDKIFWDVNYDNNHPLYTAWLYLIGPHASFMAMRALSIVTGTGAVAAAGAWAARRSRIAALATMLLFATSYLMVHYASEARGYGGATLCMILAAREVDRLIDGQGSKILLTLWTLLGCLFHLDMCLTLGVLVLAYLWIKWRQTKNISATIDSAFSVFRGPAAASALVLAPLLLYTFKIGTIVPFHRDWFLTAYNLSLQCAANVPGLAFTYANIALAVPIALLWSVRHRGDFRAAFYLSALLFLPLAICVLRMAETNYPRHMIVCDIACLMLLAETADTAWKRNRLARIGVSVCLAAVIVGNCLLLHKFLPAGRGHYEQAIMAMTANGPASYSLDLPQLTAMIDFYSDRLGRRPPRFVPLATWCAQGGSDWLILDSIMLTTLPDTHIAWGPPACPQNYDRQEIFPAWGLSGASWLLYKRSVTP